MANPWGLPSRDERPHAVKTKPCKDEGLYKAWGLSHDYCQCCGIRNGACWPGLQTHHIIKSGRSHDPCNLIRLCGRCHDLTEGATIRVDPHDKTSMPLPKLPIAICLRIKQVREVVEWDAERLAVLYKKPLPEIGVIPKLFEIMFRKRHPELESLFDTKALAI